MIRADQPTVFPDSILVRVSSRDDGTVLDRTKLLIHDPTVVRTRQAFCEKNGVNYDDVVYQRIMYSDTATYNLIAEVDDRSTTKHTQEVVADALFTREKGVGMLLPVADCVATVVYDPVHDLLAVAHMGRHSTLTDLLTRLVAHFEANGAGAADLIVWMSPHATIKHYALEHFDQIHDEDWQGFVEIRDDGVHIDMSGHNRQVLVRADVRVENITISPIDTVESQDYFSHSRGGIHGRFAVLAMMK